MNKLVIFDLDGVLVESKNTHYTALNNALEKIGPQYKIDLAEHLSIYDGLPTKIKLNKLSELKGLPKELFDEIWQLKQEETLKIFSTSIKKNYNLIECFSLLKKANIKIAVASNSIKSTINLILKKLGLELLVDTIKSHDDVLRDKPYPETYWRCMIDVGSIPENTIILEDSHIGRQAAIDSKCHMIGIDSPKAINIEMINKIISFLNKDNKNDKWKSINLNVLIPMAGEGSRFSSMGFTFPKPLIEVRGKPMIQVVIENLNIQANYIFIVQKSHYEKYNLNYLLLLLAPNCKIIQVNSKTEGAACTTLLAKDLIDNDEQLLIANSDQFIEWNSSETIYSFINRNIDAGIITFKSTHPKWSFVKLDDCGYVIEVAEKKPISNLATAGIYFWKKGSDYVKYAEEMIRKNIKFNNEFYVCPVFNEAILDRKKIITKEISSEGMWGLGTPEDLKYFIENYNGRI